MGVNVYEMINTRILELLEKGTVQWKRSWNVTSSMPRSLTSKKEYRGTQSQTCVDDIDVELVV